MIKKKWSISMKSKLGSQDCIFYKDNRESCTSSLPVFFTEASTVSLSQGIRVFRSISSQEIPSWKYSEYPLPESLNFIQRNIGNFKIEQVPCLFSIKTGLFHDGKLSSPTNKGNVTTFSNNLTSNQQIQSRLRCYKIIIYIYITHTYALMSLYFIPQTHLII